MSFAWANEHQGKPINYERLIWTLPRLVQCLYVFRPVRKMDDACPGLRPGKSSFSLFPALFNLFHHVAS